MRKNSKGFTLVELLAIIVILAIIALITTPVILNIIENSRLNAAKDKAWGTIDAVRLTYAAAQISNQGVELPYTINYPKTSASDSMIDTVTGGGKGRGYINSEEVKASGENPTAGSVTIRKDGSIIAKSLKFGNYYCSTISGEGGKIDANKMYCSKTNSILFTALDLCNDDFVVTSGDGIYKDTTETGRCVYKGDNPNNYIKLGSDLYRIISVESDSTLKVIKNESISNMVFDPGYDTSISGVTETNSVTGTRYSNVSTDYCYESSGTEKYYSGCNVWGSKTTMLDSSGNNITQMPRKIGGTSYDLPEKEAYINTYLNSTWLNTLSTDVQNKIVTHMFNVGVVDYYSLLNETIAQEQAYKWRGKVGLMNASDYIKANNNSSCTNIVNSYDVTYSGGTCNSWMRNILSFSVSSKSCEYASQGFKVHRAGFNVGIVDDFSGVFPTFYLSSDIILKGEGTASNPYVVV